MSCACHAEVCIVGGLLQVRQGVVEFMPHSFAVVNAASTKFKDVERRFNYTTPKTFLELIKLYKGVLGRKRKATTDNIDRLETGLTKLQKTKKDVDVLVEEAKRMAVQVQEKVRDADAFAEKVGEEKVKVNAENEAAQIEKEKCEQIAVEVTEKQASCEKDLAAALPLVEQVNDCFSCSFVLPLFSLVRVFGLVQQGWHRAVARSVSPNGAPDKGTRCHRYW